MKMQESEIRDQLQFINSLVFHYVTAVDPRYLDFGYLE